jgi:hypothetical protein
MPMTCFKEIKKINPKYICKHKRHQIDKQIKKNNVGDNTIPQFKLHYRAIAIKTACHKQKKYMKTKWNRIENPDINHATTAIGFLTKESRTYI